MAETALADVYTAGELARAVGVPLASARAMAASGALRPIPGTAFFDADGIIRSAARLRAAAVNAISVPVREAFVRHPTVAAPRTRLTLLASSGVHASLLLLAVLLSSGPIEPAPAPVDEPPRLVFLITRGPGGGGGGSGARARTPAPRLERAGTSRAAVSTPVVTPDPTLALSRREEQPRPAAVVQKPELTPPEPLSSRAVIAPVVMAAASPRERQGDVTSRLEDETASPGPGTGSEAGAGRGDGSGQGLGSGIGPGSGGGTGGGPYRPGSGIQPPRLLREVKAEYTEEARRRGLTGDVTLEIVVTRDGRVGTVTLVRGMGAGLDERAVAAVRQWQFAPATRLGEAIDVVVEVSVEFAMR
jgi:periplasmic protein TonB